MNRWHNRLPLVLALAGASALPGCVPRTTGPTEVGVKFSKLTRSVDTYPPGATYFQLPFVNDWRTFDTSTQNLVMTRKPGGGDRQDKDDLRFKTRDGNDIETDVTVRWRIDPEKVVQVWRFVAQDMDEVKNLVVRPMARTYVRDVLNRLDSEDFYNPQLRFQAASDATTLLARHLARFGVVVEQVLLGDFSFKPEYQKLINERKEAEKQAEKLEAEIFATQEANKARLQETIAKLTEELTRAQGELDQSRKEADAYVIRRDQEGKAILAERTAQAEGLRKERAALNSSAGDAYVDLQLIEALQQKEIRQIPRLPGGNIIMDGNRLLEQLGVVRYQLKQEAPPPQQ